jgi:hypothetical protein
MLQVAGVRCRCGDLCLEWSQSTGPASKAERGVAGTWIALTWRDGMEVHLFRWAVNEAWAFWPSSLGRVPRNWGHPGLCA